MNTSNHTTTSTPISTDFQLRIDAEARRQADDLRYAELEVTRLDLKVRSSFCSLVNVSNKTIHVTGEHVEAYYRQRYNLPATAPAPYAAKQAERDILDAGVPGWMVTVICRKANLSADYRTSVTEQIAAYFALKATQYERHAATLARVLALPTGA